VPRGLGWGAFASPFHAITFLQWSGLAQAFLLSPRASRTVELAMILDAFEPAFGEDCDCVRAVLRIETSAPGSPTRPLPETPDASTREGRGPRTPRAGLPSLASEAWLDELDEQLRGAWSPEKLRGLRVRVAVVVGDAQMPAPERAALRAEVERRGTERFGDVVEWTRPPDAEATKGPRPGTPAGATPAGARRASGPVAAYALDAGYRTLMDLLLLRDADLAVTAYAAPAARLAAGWLSVTRHFGDRFVVQRSQIGLVDVGPEWATIDGPQWFGFDNPSALSGCAAEARAAPLADGDDDAARGSDMERRSFRRSGPAEDAAWRRCAEALQSERGIAFHGHYADDFRIA
jgi:hypothetical protein